VPDRKQGCRVPQPPPFAALPLILAIAIASGLVGKARATETQWWVVDQAAQHAESVLHGATVEPDGAFELGPRASSAQSAESLGTVWAIALRKDGSVALAGDRGRIDRWTAADGIRPWVKLAAGQVLSLVVDGDALLAGTGPDGTIYRIGARGDTSVVVRTGERYVWGLAPGRNGAWYAATGTRGRVLRIEGGRARVVLDTDESNLVSIIPDGAGGIYAGGDSKGRVVHVRADGSARTVFDAPEDEVRALALGADGALYAGALNAAAVSGTAPAAGGASPAGDDADSGETEAPAAGSAPAPSRGAAGHATLYRIVPDSSASVWWTAPQALIYALARTPDGIVAATGNRAGVYFVPRANGGMPWLAAPQGQITALAVDRQGRVFAAASNPASLWQLGPGRAERGELVSPVFDAKRIARWGRIAWRGDARGGKVELATRSGNTDTPDTTWTPWERAASGERVGSPAGRYLQWRATLVGGAPRVEAVDVAWREQNLAPRVDDVAVAPQGQAFREGELVPRSEPVTQTLPGGQKVEYSIPPAGTPRQLRELPAWARGIRTVQWKAGDPNGDPLRYRVEVGSSVEGPWIQLGDDLDVPSFTWDTHTLADGIYRIRVTATDLPGNALGEEQTASGLSEPFRVDNTPPEVTAFSASAASGAIHCQGSARDAASPVARAEVAVDNMDWRPLTPDGGFADDLALAFHCTIPGVKPGEHEVGVRFVDLAGNAATRATRVTVPAR